jgi:tetratricopeptide (TPR) repeat protein
LKIAATTLTTLVALPEKQNIDIYIEDIIDAGNELIRSVNDPILQTRFYWDTSIALYDAVQIFFFFEQFSSALKYGGLTAQYMKEGISGRNSDADSYLLGRLYFRLGVIHVVSNGNHRAAIEWFDLAKPIFEGLLPKIDACALGVFGETLVSMGVSYWETGQREEAVRLTERGLRQIERGVRANVLDPSMQFAPYANLEKMYRALGDQEQALKYSRLAESINPERGKVR